MTQSAQRCCTYRTNIQVWSVWQTIEVKGLSHKTQSDTNRYESKVCSVQQFFLKCLILLKGDIQRRNTTVLPNEVQCVLVNYFMDCCIQWLYTLYSWVNYDLKKSLAGLELLYFCDIFWYFLLDLYCLYWSYFRDDILFYVCILFVFEICKERYPCCWYVMFLSHCMGL